MIGYRVCTNLNAFFQTLSSEFKTRGGYLGKWKVRIYAAPKGAFLCLKVPEGSEKWEK